MKKSNESTSGLVEEDYHRGDRTQYKYLSESTQKKLLNFAFSVGGSQYVITEDSYQDAKGEQRTLYSLNKKASILLASGYDVVLRAKIIDRWEALETGKAEPTISSVKTEVKQPTLSDKMKVATWLIKTLNLMIAPSCSLQRASQTRSVCLLPTTLHHMEYSNLRLNYSKKRVCLSAHRRLIKERFRKVSCVILKGNHQKVEISISNL